jgi:hypothetical protein
MKVVLLLGALVSASSAAAQAYPVYGQPSVVIGASQAGAIDHSVSGAQFNTSNERVILPTFARPAARAHALPRKEAKAKAQAEAAVAPPTS